MHGAYAPFKGNYSVIWSILLSTMCVLLMCVCLRVCICEKATRFTFLTQIAFPNRSEANAPSAHISLNRHIRLAGRRRHHQSAIAARAHAAAAPRLSGRRRSGRRRTRGRCGSRGRGRRYRCGGRHRGGSNRGGGR